MRRSDKNLKALGVNPKAEGRNPKEGRRPKAENLGRDLGINFAPRKGLSFSEVRISDFGFLSDFGLRPSDFNL